MPRLSHHNRYKPYHFGSKSEASWKPKVTKKRAVVAI